MNIQVLDIQPCLEGHLFDVQVLVEREPDVFKVKVQEDKMDKPSIQVASADKYSRQRMQHDARLMSQIDRLVLRVYNGEEVLLPLTITEHSRLWTGGSRQDTWHNRQTGKKLDLTLQPAF